MSGVDDYIVQMKFDNDRFERNLATTLGSLDKLTESLNKLGSANAFDGLSESVNDVNFSSMESSLDKISSKFSLLGAVAFSAIQKITGGLLDFVKNTAGDILGPIITGGKQRALNIEQAKFMFRGLGIDVEKGMKSALDAVLGTAYGLDEAAKAAAQFGASGINVGAEMTSALRGVAGTAALTGKSFSEMADIFAGSAGSGKVTNMDLMQFATRGLNAAAALGKVMGKTEAEIHSMAANGELDFKTFAAAMDKAFGEHATKANETYAGSLANLRAAMSRLGASFFGDRLIQQRDLFNALTPVLDNVTKALKPLIDTVNKFTRLGTDKLIGFLNNLKFDNFKAAIVNIAAGLENIFRAFGQIIKFGKEAFRDIFPKSAVSTLLNLSALFLKLTEHLKIGSKAGNNIREVFRGLFSIVAIGKELLFELFHGLGIIFGALSGTSGGVLSLAAKLGILLQALRQILVEENGIHNFFVRIGEYIAIAIEFIHKIVESISNLFSGFKGSSALESSIGRVSSRVENLSNTFSNFDSSGLFKVLDVIKDVFGQIWHYISNWFSELGSKLADALGPGDFDAALDAINIGLLGGIIFLLKKFLSGDFLGKLGGGLLDKVGGVLDDLSGHLKAMQTNVKADTLMKIAIAVGILTASVLVLSMIDSAALTKALIAMAVGFGEMIGVMALLGETTSGPTGAVKVGIVAGALVLLSTAMLIFAGAVAILATLSWNDLAQGLVGLGVSLGLMVAAMNLLPPSPLLIAAGLAMIPLAIGINLIAAAVKIFSLMSWGDMIKGLAGVAISLGLIVAAVNLMPIASTLVAGLAMIPLAIGINLLSGAVKIFSLLSWGEMLKGMVALAAVLGIISVAMHLMPLTLPLTAAGLLLVGIALNSISLAVLSMGAMNLGTLAKGIGSIAIMLGILAIGLTAMSGTVAGTFALLNAAVALAMLAKVVKTLGSMSIKEIAIGLGALAAVFVVLGLAALVLTPIIPSLFSLGVALALIGGAMALFGVGAYLVAKAFDAMAKAGKAGIRSLIDSIKMFIGASSEFVGAAVMAIVNIAKTFLNAAPLVLKLITVLLLQILDTIIKVVPKLAEALGVFISYGLKLIREKYPEFLQTGFELLLELLKGIRNNIGEITTLGVEIVINLAKTLVDNANRLAAAAIELLTSFLVGVASRAGDIVTAGVNILLALISGIVDNLGRLVKTASDIVVNFVKAIVDMHGEIISAGIDIIVTFIKGITDNIIKVVSAGVDLVLAVIQGISDSVLRFATAAADLVIGFLNGLAEVIREKTPELIDAGKNIASAVVGGFLEGIKAIPVIGPAMGLAEDVIGAVSGVFKSDSPSKVFIGIGKSVVQGLGIGIGNDDTAKNSAVEQAERIVKAFHESLSKLTSDVSGLDELNPVITPVLDLTKVQLASKDLNRLLSVSEITPGISYSHARLISTTAELESKEPVEPVSSIPTEIKFEQNIYAPTELSTNDIYRNTKSQIVLAKEELSIP